jgi:hypothetical protein
MKIKQDFVTNSSSTSYLISCPNPLVIEKGSIIYDLFKSMVEYFDVINTIEELNKFWKNQYGINEIPEYYNECLEVINNGGSIISASFSYGDENDFPSEFIKKHGGKIILEN